jgi:hypothetical protein
MSISTYAELSTAIVNWLDVPAASFPSGGISDLITVGEKRLFREARSRDMEYALSDTIAAGVIALPASYVSLKFAYINGSPISRLERRPAEWIYQQYPIRSSTGRPKFIGRDSTNFVFGPYPDSGYTVKGIYYRRLTVIETAPNALFLANPDLYLFACLAECEPLIGRDARITLWEAKYQKILSMINGEDRAEDASGGGLQMRVSDNLQMVSR